MKYPISHSLGKNLGEFFYDILTFHVPFSKEITILDPTCGKRHLWVEFLQTDLDGKIILEKYGKVVFADVVDYDQEIVSDISELEFENAFDCVVYDPPYFFGYLNSTDPRKEDYGEYTQDYKEFERFIDFANKEFPIWLKTDGKLIVKCADQYQTKERKFYPHHHTWIQKLTNFNLIDMYVFIHHRISPTAFQVKNRPCSIIMHTYFLVFKKKSN